MAATLMDRLLEVAGQQRGYLVPADAEAVDVNPVELRKLAARGRLNRVAHGVYRFPTFPNRPGDELMEAVAWTGKRGVIAGATALAVRELCDVNPGRIEMAVPPTYRPRKKGGDLYWFLVERLGPGDVEIVDDIPVVIPAVAIAEAIDEHIDPALIDQAITTARRRGELTTKDEARLRQRVRNVTVRGWRANTLEEPR